MCRIHARAGDPPGSGPPRNAELTERDIRSYCARHLEDFMLPKYIEILAELPRNDNGKVDKKQLATL